MVENNHMQLASLYNQYMSFNNHKKHSIQVHLTNVTGVGASQLMQSLVPALERVQKVNIISIDLPDRGSLANYLSNSPDTVLRIYRRSLPNSISRVLECILLNRRFSSDIALLVFGDLPLRCSSPQTVFIQQSNLLKPWWTYIKSGQVKYALSRAILKYNLALVRAFIVQTDVMKQTLESLYPSVIGRVHVVMQPVPVWLLKSGLKRQGRMTEHVDSLSLIYPSAGYQHKNHALLSKIDSLYEWPVKELKLTLAEASCPSPMLPWLKCVGFLSAEGMVKAYSEVDALLFLSKEESYGFPLIEAMFVGLPIVCPDLPYARVLCGEQAIYFDPDCPRSLLSALHRLKRMLDEGWWPCWTEHLDSIPKSWDNVAEQFFSIALGQ